MGRGAIARNIEIAADEALLRPAGHAVAVYETFRLKAFNGYIEFFKKHLKTP